jgi:hypothetical protein
VTSSCRGLEEDAGERSAPPYANRTHGGGLDRPARGPNAYDSSTNGEIPEEFEGRFEGDRAVATEGARHSAIGRRDLAVETVVCTVKRRVFAVKRRVFTVQSAVFTVKTTVFAVKRLLFAV